MPKLRKYTELGHMGGHHIDTDKLKVLGNLLGGNAKVDAMTECKCKHRIDSIRFAERLIYTMNPINRPANSRSHGV